MPYPALSRRSELDSKIRSIVGQQNDALVRFLQHAHNSDGTLSDLTDFTDIPYLAANFFGSASMTWTVTQANVTYLRYALIGTIMILQGSIVTTNVAGTPDTDLRIRLPKNPDTGRRFRWGRVDTIDYLLYRDAGGARTIGNALASASQTYLSLQKIDASNWTSTAGSDTTVHFNITAQVNLTA